MSVVQEIPTTIDGACRVLAPEDELDRRFARGEQTAADQKEGADRRMACVNAALSLVRKFFPDLDEDSAAVLNAVAAFVDKPGEKTRETVASVLDKSDLTMKFTGRDGTITPRQNTPSPGRKAAWNTAKAALADKPSAAGSFLRTLALKAAAVHEQANRQPSGTAHPVVIGVILAHSR